MSLFNINGVWPAPLLDDVHHAQIHDINLTTGTIAFDNSVTYQFRSPDLLRQAIAVKYIPPNVAPGDPTPRNNINIAWHGDATLKQILSAGWMTDNCPPSVYIEYLTLQLTSAYNVLEEKKTWMELGMLMNSYQTYQCDAIGLTPFLQIFGVFPGSEVAMEFWASREGRKGKATSIEAIIGAVQQDSGQNNAVTKVVMRHMGFYWPENSYQTATLQAAMSELSALGVVGKI
ncbi:hypothetical protein CERZMDRAFT_92851 [Cercospora zeae-maydis SCOH1-5]|uniref:Uncharacterized protein n=1 Tax=Cercospora zeae-maydis SCOH1-5 TaxID=717836 RepID=A0A6A6FU91_9PEZI|nr:hypothetical protein CERZMDRAFT_92851 [Cercospora zeae-maydis SCOH1-5]